MALKSCKECGNQVSNKADQCPHCGMPLKSKNIGCLPTLLIIIGVIIIFAKVINVLEERSEKQARIEKQKIEAKQELVEKNNFNKSIETHYNNLITEFKSQKYNLATKEINLFKKYGHFDYKDVKNYDKKLTIITLEQELKKIPVSKFQENLKIYKQLLNLDNDNSMYKRKIAFYQAKIEEQKKEEERERKEEKRRIAKYGEPPTNSAWDGSIRCVKQYLKEIAKDPDSLKFEKWSKVYFSENDGWIVWCQYRAKNSFGGYVKDINWFVIRHNIVVEMKDIDAYTIN